MNQSEINMKNLKPIIFIVIVLVLTAISAYPQRKFVGKVVEVIDGKTFVMEMPSGKVTAVLQYIEIPETDQPLHQTVKEHLQALIFDKTVEFLPRGVMQNKALGKLLVKGVDVSQQMLRDGAAWYSVSQKNGQDESESLLYQDNETQAKAEKRGVWGVENLKPSWVFRAEKEALRKKQEEEVIAGMKLAKEVQNQKKRLSQPQQTVPQTEMWADVSGDNSEYDKPLGIGGLRAGNITSLKVGHISIPTFYPDFPNKDFLRKIEIRIFYVYQGDKVNIEESHYIIGFMTTTKDYKFTKSTGASLTVDGQKIVLGKLERFPRQNISSVSELMVYRITRAQLESLVKAQKISVQLGDYSGTIPTDFEMYLENLLNVTQ